MSFLEQKEIAISKIGDLATQPNIWNTMKQAIVTILVMLRTTWKLNSEIMCVVMKWRSQKIILLPRSTPYFLFHFSVRPKKQNITLKKKWNKVFSCKNNTRSKQAFKKRSNLTFAFCCRFDIQSATRDLPQLFGQYIVKTFLIFDLQKCGNLCWRFERN